MDCSKCKCQKCEQSALGSCFEFIMAAAMFGAVVWWAIWITDAVMKIQKMVK